MRSHKLPILMLATGFWLLTPSGHAAEPEYAQAIAPREFAFPRDHGRHDGFKTEWWYFTGNLREVSTGRRFGYQLTFFRTAFVKEAADRKSPWGMKDLYFAHAAVTDVADKGFVYADRLGRGREGFAWASEKTLDVVLKDWSAKLDGEVMKLVAGEEGLGIELSASEGKTVLQGPGGLNAKGPAVGQASYYYSVTRLKTTGTLVVRGKRYQVEGLSWMDHEFSSNALSASQSGWDWLALTRNDGREVMIYRLRDKQGGTDYLSGTVIDKDGVVRHLKREEIELIPSKPWKSRASGASYPLEWKVIVKGLGAMNVRALLENQELQTPNSTDVTYYEGAVDVLDEAGGASGEGYLEMTGYAKALGGSF